MMNKYDYIKKWDDQYCEQHVINLVNNISQILINYYNDTSIYLIDIGANVGKVYDLLSQKINIEQAYLFEANKKLYNYMVDKYKKNNKIKLYHNAVSFEEKSTYFDESSIDYQIENNSNDLNFGLSKITNSPTPNSVDSIKISNFFNNHNYLYSKKCFIKIDTENYDFFILNDILSILNQFLFKPIIEFEINYSASTLSFNDAQLILEKYYQDYNYNKINLETTSGDGILVSYNNE